MQNIADYQTYINKMSQTYEDKCWWISRLPDNVDTIVDFGCADAGIFEYIELHFPDKYKYIGIDSNPDMIAMAKAKYEGKNDRVSFVSSLSEITDIDKNNTVLILNSVLHEIFTYLPVDDAVYLIWDIRNFGAAFIGVRDMHLCESVCLDNYKDIIEKIKTFCPEKFSEYDRSVFYSRRDMNYIVEFLLKYFYTENWEREVNERYLWNWSQMPLFQNYDVLYSEAFSIKFLEDKWKKDLGIDLDVTTHRKMLFAKK